MKMRSLEAHVSDLEPAHLLAPRARQEVGGDDGAQPRRLAAIVPRPAERLRRADQERCLPDLQEVGLPPAGPGLVPELRDGVPDHARHALLDGACVERAEGGQVLPLASSSQRAAAAVRAARQRVLIAAHPRGVDLRQRSAVAEEFSRRRQVTADVLEPLLRDPILRAERAHVVLPVGDEGAGQLPP